MASAQFFVKQGTILSFTTPETLLSSQESLNQIEAPITGKGTLYLNSTSQQQLVSTQTNLVLPSLFIQNAHLVQIQTALKIQHLEIENGQLQLNHPLLLPNPRALKLGATAGIANNSKHLLLYTTQFQASNPLALQSIALLKYTVPKTSQERPQAALITTATTSNFGSLANNGTVYSKHSTPPPEAVEDLVLRTQYLAKVNLNGHKESTYQQAGLTKEGRRSTTLKRHAKAWQVTGRSVTLSAVEVLSQP